MKMTNSKWEVVAEVYGDLEAEIIRGLLQAENIPVTLSKEGAGQALGLQVGIMGEVQVLVPSEYVSNARDIVDDYFSGNYTPEEDEDSTNLQ
jgi:hypothetical protein